MFGRLAMGFAHVRAGTRVRMLVLAQGGLTKVRAEGANTKGYSSTYLAMGFASVRASRYGIRSCSGGYSRTNAGAGAGVPAASVALGGRGATARQCPL